MSTYERLPIDVFGRALVTSGDLDPVYVCLCGACFDIDSLRRWLLAYWCCYHVGASSWLSEQSGDDYWRSLKAMALNDAPTPLGGRWPRGKERRHFRGAVAVRAVDTMAELYQSPEALVIYLEANCGHTYAALRVAVLTLPLFGPWIAFKVGDMLERVMQCRVDFSAADMLMFEQPRAAAIMLADTLVPGPARSENDSIVMATSYLLKEFQSLSAPPRGDRPIGMQEVETVLCKWKSHMGGHYPLGNDIFEIRHGLADWAPVSTTAATLLLAAPPLLAGKRLF